MHGETLKKKVFIEFISHVSNACHMERVKFYISLTVHHVIILGE